jgi:uncharacterized membrane protein YbhN (UPF0104 family)
MRCYRDRRRRPTSGTAASARVAVCGGSASNRPPPVLQAMPAAGEEEPVTDLPEQLWDTLTSVSVPLLALGIVFQTLQTCLVALAWRNILRTSYPDGGVKYRQVLGHYAGGTGLNAILPASAGTVAMLGLFRTSIRGSTVAGLVGATLVQNVFFAIMGGIVYLWLFLGVAGSFDVKFGWFSGHSVAALVLVVAGGVLVVTVIRILWRRMQQRWQEAKEGAVILTMPRRFLIDVVGVEALSYAARMGVNATFMYAYDIPVSITNVFLIVAAASISSTVAIAPGALGAQTALASVVLRGVAPASAISAYTIGQGVITTAWNALFGLTMLARTIGWDATRKLMHRNEKGPVEDPSL